jgi:hypothetical protein
MAQHGHDSHVRAPRPDVTTYSTEDWRYALLASLGAELTDREDAIRAAAEWAREHLGLDFARLRADGHIAKSLRTAINSAIRRGDVIRHDAKWISRAQGRPAAVAPQLGQTSIAESPERDDRDDASDD